MQTATQFIEQIHKIGSSFILASSYDPTTLYLNESVFDRDEFKRLKKEGLLEISFQNNREKRYALSNKAKKLLKNN